MTTTPSELKKQMIEINSHSPNDVMIIPQTKNAFMQLFGEKHGAIALAKETTYFNELMMGENGEKLKNCSTISLQSSIMTILSDGLSLSPILQEATIVPYFSSKTGVTTAKVTIMYSGKVKMLTSSGVVSLIKYNEVVWDCDTTTCHNGFYSHSKVLKRPKNAERLGVLLIAVMPDKNERHIFIDADELAKRKACSKNQDRWDKWTDQYWKKTAIHELFKYLPKTKVVLDMKEKFEEEIVVETHDTTYEEVPETQTPTIPDEPEQELQDPILVEVLSGLIEEFGAKLLSADQIEKTKNGLLSYNNATLEVLIKRMEDGRDKLTTKEDDKNSPPF